MRNDWIAPRTALFALLAAQFVSGCRSTTPDPAIDLSQPGWRTQQGQAIWRSRADMPEIAGELLVASHADGRTFVQFTKPPLPFIVARSSRQSWQITFVPDNKTYSGRGTPPRRLIWLYLPQCLAGNHSQADWSVQRLPGGRWRLQNSVSGELVEGYLEPGLPEKHFSQPGDTLKSIARRYGVSEKSLLDANPELIAGRTAAVTGDRVISIPIP